MGGDGAVGGTGGESDGGGDDGGDGSAQRAAGDPSAAHVCGQMSAPVEETVNGKGGAQTSPLTDANVESVLAVAVHGAGAPTVTRNVAITPAQSVPTFSAASDANAFGTSRHVSPPGDAIGGGSLGGMGGMGGCCGVEPHSVGDAKPNPAHETGHTSAISDAVVKAAGGAQLPNPNAESSLLNESTVLGQANDGCRSDERPVHCVSTMALPREANYDEGLEGTRVYVGMQQEGGGGMTS